MDELIEMNEQEIEELESLNPVQSDRMTVVYVCGKFLHEHSLEDAGNAATNELTRDKGISERTQDAEVEDPGLRKRSNENSGRVGTHHPLFTRETRRSLSTPKYQRLS
ncbi:hypothetical protein TNCV_4530671 [Trichonephila clavipes]|nr:hypothetical protein TNCV_4530671 [Trichonephila clavipes]